MRLWLAAACIAAVNLAIRGTWIAAVHPDPSSDYAWYFNAATRLADGLGYVQGNGEPTAFWPVGWPFTLSVIFRFTGPSVAAGLVLQTVLSAVTAALVTVLAHRLTGDLRVAVAAGVAYTLLPSGWAWDSQLGSEQTFTVLVVAMLLVLAGAEGSSRFAVAGALAGLACLVRPTLLVFPPALLLIELLRRCALRRALLHTVAFTLAMSVVIAPWTSRNAVVLGSPVPVSTNGGINLYQGTRTTSGYWWSSDPADNPLLRTDDEVVRDQMGTDLAFEFWSEHPGRLVAEAPSRIAGLYSGNETPFRWLHIHGDWSPETYRRWQRAADLVYWSLMAVACVGALALGRRRRQALSLLGGFLVFYTALWCLFPTWDRFRFPLMPVFAVLAGCGFLSSRSTDTSASASGNNPRPRSRV
ncbi:glycosyltransferase family 39 protein [Streptomyces sp. NPDC051243]|uniref:glycosyltransferase family 39 protein n=1 Tax=Streptomyces sp. NPDC051243 TaxID=3365646 RepID=UPI0037A3ADDD